MNNLLSINYAMQLVQASPSTLFGDLAFNALMSGHLNNLQSAPLPRPDIMGMALTGRMRSDAGMLRQGAKNLGQAQAMMDTAAKGLDSIKDLTTQMKDVATKISEGTLNAVQGAELYASLSTQIDGLVKSTSYNGMSLLDGSTWSKDERFTVNGADKSKPASASVSIRAGGSDFNLSLVNVSSGPTNLTKLAEQPGLTLNTTGTEAEMQAAAAAVATKLSETISTVGTVGELYTARAKGLSNQATALNSQADIVDTAVKNQTRVTRPSSESLLLDLLNPQGKIVSEKG